MQGVAATILDGKATASAVKAELATRVAALKERGINPGLGTILVGDDPGSHAYVGGKHRDCAEVGIASIRRDLPADATQGDVEADTGAERPDCPAPSTTSATSPATAAARSLRRGCVARWLGRACTGGLLGAGGRAGTRDLGSGEAAVPI